MKKQDVQLNHKYLVKVSGKLVPVAIVQENPLGGWNGINLLTHRGVRIHTAARLRRRLDDATIAIGTRVAISIDQGLQKAQGVIREVETDDNGIAYRVDVTGGDPCNEHRTADGELWVCQFEVTPLPA